jgi:hypothetical protein
MPNLTFHLNLSITSSYSSGMMRNNRGSGKMFHNETVPGRPGRYAWIMRNETKLIAAMAQLDLIGDTMKHHVPN